MSEIILFTRSFAFYGEKDADTNAIRLFINFSATGTTDLPDAKPTGRILMDKKMFLRFADAVAESASEVRNQDGI